VFGVLLTQGVATFCMKNNECRSEDYTEHLKYFGSLPRSMYSLYKAMSGGVDWGDPADPLSDLGLPYVACYIFFITFATIAIMNIVTGVFVEVAMAAAQTDRDSLIQDRAHRKETYLEAMRNVFLEIDDNRDGVITLQELEKNIADPRMMGYLEALDLDVSDIKTLHRLCDLDGQGSVDVDEFIGGCSRLKGDASAMDVAMMQSAFHAELSSLRGHMDFRFNELRPPKTVRPALQPPNFPRVIARVAAPKSLNKVGQALNKRKVVAALSLALY